MQVDMPSRKRSSSCCLELEGAPEQENIARQRPKSLGAQEAHEWLSRHGMDALLQQPQGPLPPAFWLALAELNISLSAFQHTFQDLKLLEQHSFTRCSTQLAFEKLAFARGCNDAQALQQQPHLQAVSAVLHTALASCAEAAIAQVTLLCPPFLAPWAARWLPTGGGGSSGAPPRLRLTIVQGYRPLQPCPLRATTVYNLGLPTITSIPAATTIYIPSAQ
ncbi:hypothetical protein ABPG75_012957 [Micractinium tetrahymenae]